MKNSQVPDNGTAAGYGPLADLSMTKEYSELLEAAKKKSLKDEMAPVDSGEKNVENVKAESNE